MDTIISNVSDLIFELNLQHANDSSLAASITIHLFTLAILTLIFIRILRFLILYNFISRAQQELRIQHFIQLRASVLVSAPTCEPIHVYAVCRPFRQGAPWLNIAKFEFNNF